MTLEPDTEALIKQLMRERGLSFKQAVNEAIRSGLGQGRRQGTQPFRTATFAMGSGAGASLDRALAITGELEDEELARRVTARK